MACQCVTCIWDDTVGDELGLSIGALVLVLPTVWPVSNTTIENPDFERDVDEKMTTEELE
jgi:hypothetical protein